MYVYIYVYIYIYTYIYIYIAISLRVLRHYEHPFLFSMSILHVTSSRFCLYLLNIRHFTYTFSRAHTGADIHKNTCIIMLIQHTRGMATIRHRSLVERGERKTFVRDLAHQKKMKKKLIFTNPNKKIQAHRASSKATKLLLTK